MANDILNSQTYLEQIDKLYKKAAKTIALDAETQPDFSGAATVKILKVNTTGLGDYDRDTGYPKGEVVATWEDMALSQSRGKEISIDRINDESDLGMTFGTVIKKFINDHVSPEVDAYRFAKYAHGAGTKKVQQMTSENVLDSIEEALFTLNTNNISENDRFFFMDFSLQPLLGKAINRTWMSENGINREIVSYNGVPIIWVPASRFYTGVDMNDGSSNWGYAKSTDGKAINFMLVQKDAVVQATKLVLPKVFTPDQNQDKDAWKFQLRLFHDAFIQENKVKGIYLSSASA